MPACHICESAVGDTFMADERPNNFLSGEVFAIEESVFTPIEHILADPEVSGLSGYQLSQSATSLHKLCTRAHATNKTPRPCILSQNFYRTDLKDIHNPRIWLMATFEGTPMSKLPPIYQFFCIAVHPNPPLACADTPTSLPPHDSEVHLHSIPEWHNSAEECNQWVIAWSFETKRPLLARWLTPEVKRKARTSARHSHDEDPMSDVDDSMGLRKGMTLGVEAYATLTVQTTARRHMWVRFCRSNKKFALERQREYQEWRDAGRNRQPSVPGSRTSYRPRSRVEAYHKTAPSQVSRSIVPETIYEDKISVFKDRPSIDGRPQAVFEKNNGKTIVKPHDSRRHVLRETQNEPYPRSSSKQQKQRTERKSNAGSSRAGSNTSIRPQKLLAQIGNRFAVLSSLRTGSMGDA
ncbi:hypothetical protein GY45DRAFT_1362984 [Cubamyces sp. BRFM 1775]|nr:hypothetical protein GY45DRAFT_1362984 [Cubamyces sp. BRFM 1775]